MKVHQQFARAFCDNNSADPNSANHTCNRLRPLIPKLPSAAADAAVDLKSFIRPDGGPRRVTTPSHSPQGEKAWWRQGQSQGGTRWNPTEQQIEILERLYRGGMRTPTAEEIEQITAQLSKYGKIEGKNVFYWFQNHKARERQKEKKRFYHAPSSPRINTSFAFNFHNSSNYKKDLGRVEEASSKRRCGTWSFGCLLPEENRISANQDHHHHRDNYTKITTPNFNNEAVEEEGEDKGHKKTLKLFPLHPEGRSMMGVSPT